MGVKLGTRISVVVPVGDYQNPYLSRLFSLRVSVEKQKVLRPSQTGPRETPEQSDVLDQRRPTTIQFLQRTEIESVKEYVRRITRRTTVTYGPWVRPSRGKTFPGDRKPFIISGH